MSYVIDAIIVLVWIGVFMGSLFIIMDGDGISKIFGVLGLIVCLASAFWAMSQPDNKPCVRYETIMQYNAATKTTMPMRYCAQYGEWVK